MNYVILTTLLRAISLAIPTIIINISTGIDVPVYIITLLPFIPLLFSSVTLLFITEILYSVVLRPGAYLYALICVVNGPQDTVAVIFYILAVLQIFGILKGLLSGLALIFSFTNKN